MNTDVSDKSHVGLCLCFYCLKNHTQKLLLDRQLKDRLPCEAVYDFEPCTECEGYMREGIILIGVDEKSMDEVPEQEKLYEAQIEQKMRQSYTPARKRRENYLPFIPNPKRTGEWLVVKDRLVRDQIPDTELAEHIIKNRWSFVDGRVLQAWQQMYEEQHGAAPKNLEELKERRAANGQAEEPPDGEAG